MSKPPDLKLYSPREIGATTNNALLAASRPETQPINPARLRKLHDYAAALTAPCKKHIEQGLLTPQELVVVYLSCALITHAAENTGGQKLPMISLAEAVEKKGGK